ncbi:2',3'-cyclic-nucleotide 3'-phosphodiesterase-like isoform X3 [Sinocyclocheilus grahami]|uniref:2',3'-cyclic-nucleotide 3'-phosphodiesterase-like isoform X1 n=1 Tax=Sinocyclocheilus grahami TaxID=75366 RepID=UPI0007ACB549|nr:PREDICTED: 2',3'-cyclic-nucleotide 3'-phosphodiesterase-like isoform X1 [Sinocyclocheilus grahami]XP_016134862.1 PREDICTED: 2',3'-cyclic-nucleotide 3'-phosphodiesterase-like isoform X2 [Sinocyclocheilus grahami]XP_016134863.1 PREDICTED: 2',3'-cyclic-nucleotide 3'-phosphodiesterase-like isoform X3 [Sinocyclocheilus grahami]
MEAEQNREVPEAVAETQEAAVQQEEKSEPRSEEVAPSEPADPPKAARKPEKTPENEPLAGELPEKEKATDSEAPPARPSEPEVALEKSPKETPAAESSEKPPEPEQQKKSEEPQVQVNSEPEKQEEEAVKEVEPKKEESAKEAESKPTAVNEAMPEESDKGEETKTEGGEDKVQPEADGVQAEPPKEAETKPKEPELPLFFGWFLLPEEEERIKCATMDFLKTLDTLEAFKEHISEFTGEAEKEVDLEQYFQNPLHLHCTTKFCDYGKAEGAKEYAELQVVKESLAKSDELSVTALIVTPRIFGARVALTETQMKLWPEGEDKEGVAPALMPSVEALPMGSRAHVTLGCSAGVEAVQTGLDLLEILALQKEGKEGTQVEMDLGTLSYLSEGRWFLTLREPITADTTFSSFSDDKPTNDQGKKDGEKKKKKCTIL